MSKVMPNPQLAAGGYGFASSKEQQEKYIDARIKSWRFFPPSRPLVKDMLRLQECLSDGYLDDEYRRSSTAAAESISAEQEEDVRAVESQAAKKPGFELLFRRVASAFGIAQHEKTMESSDEQITQHQIFVSERIYNHMAMLGRTPGTMMGEPFSIREELTARLAGKVGLGLYLSPRVENDLRQESESVMLSLAGEYQEWLVERTKEGPFETTWGYISLFGQPIPKEVRATCPLILIADVGDSKTAP